MRLHDRPLRPAKLAGFEQHRVRHLELADVVELCPLTQARQRLVAEAEQAPQEAAMSVTRCVCPAVPMSRSSSATPSPNMPTSRGSRSSRTTLSRPSTCPKRRTIVCAARLICGVTGRHAEKVSVLKGPTTSPCFRTETMRQLLKPAANRCESA